MATVLKGEQRGKSGSYRVGRDGAVIELQKRYTVLSDVKNESIFTVLNTSGLPIVNVPDANGLTCVNLDPKQDEQSPYVWYVDAEWTTDNQLQDTGGNPDPTTWTPIWIGKMETYDEVVYEDFSSPAKPYVNSAKCKFPEPLIVKRPIIVFNFFQYESPTLALDTIADRNDTMNSATVKSLFPANTLKLTIESFERGRFFNYPATKINYSIAYKKSKWLNRPLDMGYEYLDASGNKLVSDFIVALNADGTKKTDNAAPVVNTEFKPHREISFSFLR